MTIMFISSCHPTFLRTLSISVYTWYTEQKNDCCTSINLFAAFLYNFETIYGDEQKKTIFPKTL